MGDLSENFSRREFACKGDNCCGHSAPISRAHVRRLQTLRDRIHTPLHINSGYRCNAHNAYIGGSPKSQHTLGLATDIARPDGLSLYMFALHAMKVFDEHGIGIYVNDYAGGEFLHLDSRPDKARWGYINSEPVSFEAALAAAKAKAEAR